ncbi:MAG: S8 family peptidase [Pseudobdellovibrionaceae bacterium]
MRILILLLCGLIASTSFAARYTVFIKDEKKFQESTRQWSFMKVRGAYKVLKVHPHLQAYLIESNDENLQSISPEVLIEKDFRHPLPKMEARTADLKLFPMDLSQQGAPWGVVTVRASEAWPLSHKGKGARVLVLDTGIDRDHPALQGQISESKNFVSDQPAPYAVIDKVGHGTHVAGIILAKEMAGGFSGVAPGARLLVGRICDLTGCSSSDMIAGIEWGIAKKVDVINLSLGDQRQTDLERAAIAKAEKAGVVVVAATGNNGSDSISYPAGYGTSVAVGAVDQELKRAPFSQYGEALDLMGPGVSIYSTFSKAALCRKAQADYCVMSGTSMASPHVAGVVALIRAANPALKPLEIRRILKSSAKTLGNSPLQYGAGLVDAEKAVTKASELR